MPASTRRLPRARAAKAPLKAMRPQHRTTGLEKPAKGTAQRERTARRGRQQGLEKLMKGWARVRDNQTCQRPGCGVRKPGEMEAMHIVDAGMGGRASVSSKRSDYVTGCRDCHRGPRSIHSTHLELRPRDPELGGDGVIDWYERDRRGNVWGPWRHIGTSAASLHGGNVLKSSPLPSVRS